jgi:hypothetical protein
MALQTLLALAAWGILLKALQILVDIFGIPGMLLRVALRFVQLLTPQGMCLLLALEG